MPTMTKDELQIRKVLLIFEAAANDYELDAWGLPMELLLDLQFVCVTKIGQQWRICTGEEEAPPQEARYPNEQRWLRVLLGVFEEALANFTGRNYLLFDLREGVTLLEALRDACKFFH